MLLFMALPALNLINLNVGRIMERSSEIGVRKARRHQPPAGRPLVMENVLLCLIGGARTGAGGRRAVVAGRLRPHPYLQSTSTSPCSAAAC
jgi:hypothetical protein